jgi:AraC-like DNA-binding protein
MKGKKKPQATATGPTPGRVWLGPVPPIGGPHNHAILTQVLSGTFAELQIGASIMDGLTWYPIHSEPSIAAFEMAYGVETRRWPYNDRCFRKARRDGQIVLGEHAGFYDLFAAIGGADGKWALVAGPFSIERPTSSDIRSRWREISGSHARPSDPEFLHYLSTTLSTTTFEGDQLDAFRQLLGCLAKLLADEGDAERAAVEVHRLRERLDRVRAVERMWEATRTIIDLRTYRAWLSQARARALALMGCARLPQHAVVGLLLGREKQSDPVEDLLKRDAFQRACVETMRKRANVLCGRIADHGLVLLVNDPSSGSRLRSRLSDIGERAAALAKRFDLRIHLGACSAEVAGSLPDRYQAALAAAEQALSRGQPIVHSAQRPRPARSLLGDQSRLVVAAVGESPKLISPRFDRFLEVLLLHCGHRLEPIRAHLETLFDQMMDALRATGTVHDKNLADLRQTLEPAAADANTVRDLSSAYRAAIADVESTLLRPPEARRDRSVRRAVTFVRDHLAEPLTVAKVARVAGFAPRYFSKLFVQTEKKTFHRYLLEARLERAKHMLLATTLTAEKVGQLTGFPTRSHFHRAFKQHEGMAPLEYREKAR